MNNKEKNSKNEPYKTLNNKKLFNYKIGNSPLSKPKLKIKFSYLVQDKLEIFVKPFV